MQDAFLKTALGTRHLERSHKQCKAMEHRRLRPQYPLHEGLVWSWHPLSSRTGRNQYHGTGTLARSRRWSDVSAAVATCCHRAHYGKMWHHPENRKYSNISEAARDDRATITCTEIKWILDVWFCRHACMQTDTHTCSSQYSVMSRGGVITAASGPPSIPCDQILACLTQPAVRNCSD